MSYFRPAMREVFKPHIVTDKDGQWCIYRSAWKAQFPGVAACIRAPTIQQLTDNINRSYDGWRFGGKVKVKHRRGPLVAPPMPPGWGA